MEAYPDAEVRVDGAREDRTADAWCTNRHLKTAHNFSLSLDRVALLGFHDGYENMWADQRTRPLLDSLASQRVLRYRATRVAAERDVLSRLIGWIFGRRGRGRERS
jgi:hypothetical protein